MTLRWNVGRALAAGLTLLLALSVAAQDSTDTKKDPPRTAKYMGQLRLLFDLWDTNSDGYLDKKELAVAFRGAGAKPYDAAAQAKKDKEEKSKKDEDADADKEKGEKDKDKDSSDKEKPKTSKKPDYSVYPDYVFLKQLDTDSDDQISKDEFMTWARDLAVQLRDQDDLLAQLKKTQAQLAKMSQKAKNRSTVEAKLQKQQQQVNKLAQQLAKYAKVQAAMKSNN